MKTHALIIILAIMLHLPNASTAQVNTQDSLALIALYNSTDGANWNNPWNISQPVSTWHGVTLDTNFRVVRLELNSRNLNGVLPNEIGDLSKLESFGIFDSPNLIGTIPTSIGNLSKLSGLGINQTSIGGIVPDEICNLSNLYGLSLSKSMFYGSLPDSIGKLTQLGNLNITYNNFTKIPSSISMLTNLFFVEISNNPNLDSLPNDFFMNNIGLTWFKAFDCNFSVLPFAGNSDFHLFYIGGNRLTFEDIEPLIVYTNDSIYGFNYWPQDSVLHEIDTTIHIGDTLVLESLIGGQYNTYCWKKNGQVVYCGPNSQLVIENANQFDAGVYNCTITNLRATKLILQRKRIRVRVDTTTTVNNSLIDEILVNYNPETHKAIFTGIDSVDKITIYDMAGKMVCQKNATTLPLEITLLQRGSYIAHITAKGKNKVLKF